MSCWLMMLAPFQAGRAFRKLLIFRLAMLSERGSPPWYWCMTLVFAVEFVVDYTCMTQRSISIILQHTFNMTSLQDDVPFLSFLLQANKRINCLPYAGIISRNRYLACSPRTLVRTQTSPSATFKTSSAATLADLSCHLTPSITTHFQDSWRRWKCALARDAPCWDERQVFQHRTSGRAPRRTCTCSTPATGKKCL